MGDAEVVEVAGFVEAVGRNRDAGVIEVTRQGQELWRAGSVELGSGSVELG